jgi:nitronate monooxygenase
VTLAELLRRPVIQAPMAGDPSTPALAAAVSAAGGLGFLAAGYKSAERVAADIAAVRAATDRPFGVNVFVPDPRPVDVAAVRRYRDSLASEATRYGVPLGEPRVDDDGWAAKLDLLVAERVPVASFAFGCPAAFEVARLRAAGTLVVATVTSVPEARIAAAAGADLLCVQGVEAGGHRGTFADAPGDTALLPLLALVSAAVDLPLVAAGGIMTAAGVAAVLAAGAVAAQCGTAFLAADEAGTPAVHRAALVDPASTTSLTRAFSGRWARGIANRFMLSHADAPAGYPAIHHVTRPLRAAAVAAGDPGGMNMWAGQGHSLVRSAPAADILRLLTA